MAHGPGPPWAQLTQFGQTVTKLNQDKPSQAVGAALSHHRRRRYRSMA